MLPGPTSGQQYIEASPRDNRRADHRRRNAARPRSVYAISVLPQRMAGDKPEKIGLVGSGAFRNSGPFVLNCLVGADRTNVAVLFRCPNTRQTVQSFLSEEVIEDAYDSVTCLACRQTIS